MDRYHNILTVYASHSSYISFPPLSPVQAVKIDEKPSKTGSKKKLQKSSSLSVNRSRSDASARTSSSVAGLASVPISGPAEEREAGRKRGRERVCRDLLRTLAEIHFIHAEVCDLYLSSECHIIRVCCSSVLCTS